ncbi:ATP-binding cassette sub-family G member 1-like protein [Dinothrombium tinctorium]|uniref:ATP-binding cassette sub-family G member 1-like protein n=1 Tax=Dinothrombium tinctorium TaxID=1965070 RepID=A0A3S3NXJ5_9ACAR|nr:ATP-binding cassette sub-family G member 1-like protein [Dinothrombium tinctorium]RWS13974.1 ATP-binding cassette sub-family G member 1-like protein [Dinothrombium tinctorium]
MAERVFQASKKSSTKNSDQPTHFTVNWCDLVYTVDKPLIYKLWLMLQGRVREVGSKTILKGLNGDFKSGELTALMGPSGAGKSTLLNCVSSKKQKGRSGFVGFSGENKINIAFIPQHDYFFSLLTVREALTFASKLQNSAFGSEGRNFELEDESKAPVNTENFHRTIVDSIIKRLGLEVCADTKIQNLSGGQAKRLAVGQELVAKPNILILDEPTSGLDSSSCYQTIELLRSLTQEAYPMAIVVTIHQPSANVFNLFHKIYVVSVIGKCIYDGPPREVVEFLASFGLQCPQFYNPADYLIEIASGDYGHQCLSEIATFVSKIQLERETQKTTKILDDWIGQPKFPPLPHLFYLTHRCVLCLKRDKLLFFFRLFVYASIAFLTSILFYDIGNISNGCPPESLWHLTLNTINKVHREIKTKRVLIRNNLGFLFMSEVVSMVAALLVNVVTLPLTVDAIKKESSNGWYQVSTYFAALTIADIPLQTFCSLLYCTIIYWATSQAPQFARFLLFWLTQLLLGFIGQTQGLLVGAIFAFNLTAAIFVAPLSSVPFLLFSCYLIKFADIPFYLKPLGYLSYFKYAFECILIAVFGMDRCGSEVGTKLLMIKRQVIFFLNSLFLHGLNVKGEDDDLKYLLKNTTDSMVDIAVSQFFIYEVTDEGKYNSPVLISYSLTEDQFWTNITLLIIYLIVLRFMSLVILLKQTTIYK